MLTPPPTETSCCPAERFTYSAVSFLTTPLATNRCGYKITVLKLSRYRSGFASMRILQTSLKSEARFARSAAKGYPTELPRMKLQSHTEVGRGGAPDTVRFSPAPHVLNTNEARFDLRIGSKTEEILYVAVSCEQDSEHSPPTYRSDFGGLTKRLATSPLQECRITTSSSRFNTCLARSEADLSMLVEGNPETDYPYAGVPWFSTVFGRDGIVTALECLWLAPAIAKGVLTYLAKTQAKETIQEQDATPGKILHEMRRGEMAALKEVPFGRYYGSVDSTPLFLILAAAYYIRTADLDFINSIWLNIESALSWIDDYGDVDGDGFVEYEQKSKKGLLATGLERLA